MTCDVDRRDIAQNHEDMEHRFTNALDKNDQKPHVLENHVSLPARVYSHL